LLSLPPLPELQVSLHTERIGAASDDKINLIMNNVNLGIDFFNMAWYSLRCQGDGTAATGHCGTLAHRETLDGA
jgi:hypothetical protein